MVNQKLFEAFFWIEPQRAKPTEAFSACKLLWSYPTDVSQICSDFKDIPQFCFPDVCTKLNMRYIYL